MYDVREPANFRLGSKTGVSMNFLSHLMGNSK